MAQAPPEQARILAGSKLILLVAVLAGCTAGVVRARINHRGLRVPELRGFGVLVLAYTPQFFIFDLHDERLQIQERTIPLVLSCSIILLLAFAWINVKQPGFCLLGLGSFLNSLAIISNGGLMPIAPETIQKLAAEISSDVLITHQRLGASKDILLAREMTRFWWFSDALVFPPSVPWRGAFSWGDIAIALGAFWFLWSLGGTRKSGSSGD